MSATRSAERKKKTKEGALAGGTLLHFTSLFYAALLNKDCLCEFTCFAVFYASISQISMIVILYLYSFCYCNLCSLTSHFIDDLIYRNFTSLSYNADLS